MTAEKRRRHPGTPMAARIPLVRKRILLLPLLLACSAHKPQEDLEGLRRQVKTSIEAGDLVNALDLADHGRDVAVHRPDTFNEWRFRLLKSTVLLLNRRAEAALPLLDGPIPQRPEFAAIEAERLLLRSRALAYLHQNSESDALLIQAQRAAEDAHATEVLIDIEVARGL